MVVKLPPALDQGSRHSEVPEPLAVQALVPQLPIEAFDEAVAPGLAGRDEGRADVLIPQPAHDRARGELRALVRADELGLAVEPHEPSERQNHVARGERAHHLDRQALPGVLIDDTEQAYRLLARQAIVHEVVAPDVIRPSCAGQADVGAAAPTSRPSARQGELELSPQTPDTPEPEIELGGRASITKARMLLSAHEQRLRQELNAVDNRALGRSAERMSSWPHLSDAKLAGSPVYKCQSAFHSWSGLHT